MRQADYESESGAELKEERCDIINFPYHILFPLLPSAQTAARNVHAVIARRCESFARTADGRFVIPGGINMTPDQTTNGLCAMGQAALAPRAPWIPRASFGWKDSDFERLARESHY